ncbi:DUF4124 domain-containing protein [Luteimonas viscosa]|uniref:DUF4124 domain-containing protein n=1 Tax=Luteimonas viscosa TaxID=1132694 RepID=A0A5D4XLT9_9GAMM|nr:DUF4124 domain-containing protein [Luteimonas viscosa]TYT25648.1 DUF4124 domain-containing protein [Luteimonas viscosa]
MKLAWAIVAGALGAGALAWWLTREERPVRPAGASEAPAGEPADAARQAPAGPALYRWRDDAGIVQITDIPPPDRDYTIVDVAALERRNTIDPNPAIEAAR